MMGVFLKDVFNLSYDGLSEPLVKDPVLITGLPRSGTTLLGKILSSLEHVEYEFEPWILLDLILYTKEGLLDPGIAKGIVKRFLEELLINHVLCRNINLRPADDSRKDIIKGMKAIKKRWKKIRSMDDVRSYVEMTKTVLLVKYPEFNAFLEDVYELISGVKVIHIVRNPFDTAFSLERRKWFSDDTLTSDYMQLRKQVAGNKNSRFYPWWVKKEDMEKFVDYSDYARSVLCWVTQMEEFSDFRKKTKRLNNKNYIEIRYEDLLIRPETVIPNLESFIGKKRTAATNRLIKDIRPKNLHKNKKNKVEGILPSDMEKVARLVDEAGYTAPEYKEFVRPCL